MLDAVLVPPIDSGTMWSPCRRLPGSPRVPHHEHQGCLAIALARRLRHWRVYGLGPTLGLRLGCSHLRRRYLGHGVNGLAIETLQKWICYFAVPNLAPETRRCVRAGGIGLRSSRFFDGRGAPRPPSHGPADRAVARSESRRPRMLRTESSRACGHCDQGCERGRSLAGLRSPRSRAGRMSSA
jgi:hypothetical protein